MIIKMGEMIYERKETDGDGMRREKEMVKRDIEGIIIDREG